MAAFTTADKSRIPDERIDELFAEFKSIGTSELNVFLSHSATRSVGSVSAFDMS